MSASPAPLGDSDTDSARFICGDGVSTTRGNVERPAGDSVMPASGGECALALHGTPIESSAMPARGRAPQQLSALATLLFTSSDILKSKAWQGGRAAKDCITGDDIITGQRDDEWNMQTRALLQLPTQN